MALKNGVYRIRIAIFFGKHGIRAAKRPEIINELFCEANLFYFKYVRIFFADPLPRSFEFRTLVLVGTSRQKSGDYA